jgi:hypothetical protein
MITILTSHNHIWNIESVVMDIVKEYQSTGKVVISMNQEGPCCDAVGLYAILDKICLTFNINKSNIKIITGNFEEQHPEYQIEKHPQYWINITYATSNGFGYSKESFLKKKHVLKNVFGCLYNIPSWNRLSLLAYIKNNTSRPNLLACNGTWESSQHNSYYLDPITDFSPTEIYNIINLIKEGVYPLPKHPGHKPSAEENTQVLEYYNDFFIDVVAETYTNGLTFFITEKTIRPMYALTPFIIFGPQGYLGTLKSDYGFKSFDNWWDESYDNYQNYERIQKIYKVIDYIDSKSDLELTNMYNDMTGTLTHNYDRLQELNDKK